MAELNEQQLGLLNSLIYLDADYSPGKPMEDIIADIRESGVLDKSDLGGGLTKENAVELLKKIEGDDALMALKVDSAVDTEIRGVCFVNTETDEATIAFRGTGPAYAAWDDNCQGGYLTDTDMQKEALAFAQDCAERYDDITVTGHSKGGNMAQYVTVLMGDEVDRCVSFDGQGFGDEFLIKYAWQIAENRDKIRSVCAYNDYVNILMNPIAGEIVYLDNAETGKGGHFIYTIIANDKNKLNDSGEYETSRNQALWLIAGKTVLNGLLTHLDIAGSEISEFLFYSLAGTIMGALMAGEEVDLEKILKEFAENLSDFLHFDFFQWVPGMQSAGVKVTVDTQALRSCGGDLSGAARQIDILRTKVAQIQKRMASNLIDGVSIGLPLQLVLSQLDKESVKLEKLAGLLDSCAELYDTAESNSKAAVK